jgi:hypothetical protein
VSEVGIAMQREYPLLWEIAKQYDFAERLGGCSEPLWAEVDAAMREIYSARQFMRGQPVQSEVQVRS